LSELLRQDRIVIVPTITPTEPKTKELLAKLKEISGKRIVIVVDGIEPNLFLAARNIPYVEVTEANNLSPVLLVSADKVIMTPEALKKIEEHLA